MPVSRNMTRAVVLGGGGMVGVGWHVGVLMGLAEAGLNLSPGGNKKADRVIGTSAGSIVGALLAKGVSLEEMARLATADATASAAQEATELIDVELMVECFGVWSTLPTAAPANLARVGAYALRAPTITEERFVASFTELTGKVWPNRTEYTCVAVDAVTGETRFWDANSAVPLDRAIASSCAVPSIFPPITIGGKRYMDGGVRSGTNADRMTGSHQVLVLAPIGSSDSDPLDKSAKIELGKEVAVLDRFGIQVEVMYPDAQTNAATLGSPLGRMDPAMRSVAIEHGHRQGVALAEVIRPFW